MNDPHDKYWFNIFLSIVNTPQRILSIIKSKLPINISKVRMQNFWCTEKILADYRKKLGRAGCCIRVNTGVMVMFDSMNQTFIG